MKQQDNNEKIKVIVNNYNLEYLAEKLAKMMPPIVDRMIRDEYRKELK